jgi:hypothetical protein
LKQTASNRRGPGDAPRRRRRPPSRSRFRVESNAMSHVRSRRLKRSQGGGLDPSRANSP